MVKENIDGLVAIDIMVTISMISLMVLVFTIQFMEIAMLVILFMENLKVG